MRVFKRLVVLTVAFALLVSLAPRLSMSVFAAGSCGDYGDNLLWSFDSDTGVLSITGSGPMVHYIFTSSAPWYGFRDSIRALSLPDGLTRIGQFAFYGCSNLTSVTIPQNVSIVGFGAFEECTSLVSVTVPPNASFADYAFPDEQAIVFNITFSNVSQLETWCTSSSPLQNSLSQYLNSERVLFWGQEEITDLIIPDGVTSIGRSAFSYCSRLKSISIPDSITSISGSSFSGCNALCDIYIHNLSAWCGITFLETWQDDEGEHSYPSHPFKMAYYLYADGNLVTNLIVPEGISTIGSFQFRNCYSLLSVTIPDHVNCIGDSAFRDCINLKNLSIQKGVTYIGDSAFLGCSIEQVTIPSSVEYIGNTAFSSIEKLTLETPTVSTWFQNSSVKTIALSNQVQAINSNAFSGCTNLTSISIPDSVTSIGAYAFSNCAGLTRVNIPKSISSIYSNTFSGCSSLTSISIPDSVTAIGDQAFSGCTHLTSVAIPGSVTSFGNNVFENCTYLHELQLDVHEVSRSMLDCCYTRLSDVTITDPNCFIEYNVNTLGVPGQTVIYGLEGSTAQRYAQRFSYEFVVYTPKPPVVFSDVPESAYYAVPVAWALEQGITSGTSDTTFSPKSTCTRAQVVTFLWRAAGSPDPTITDNPFTDVKSGKYYYKAVLWAAESGITSGTSDTKFSPNVECTRAQVVTFLWRFAGCPEPESEENPFKDVKKKASYFKAVLWAVEQGITNGTSSTTFSPGNTCTRAHVVTFLYRALA